MKFVTIDFETANEKRNSACALGICVVENNKIIEQKYWLIKPEEMRFEKTNIWIHGIYPEDVENEKTFNELWDEIKPYLENNLVIAHNASFDMSVLRKTLESYNLSFPELYYGCTLILSRNHYPALDNHKLNTVASSLGYDFNHHHAGEDAAACAQIMIDICKNQKINDLVSLNLKGGMKLGAIFDGGYEACSSLVKGLTRNKAKEEVDFDVFAIDCDFFNNKTVVFTGPLETMRRHDAYTLVRKMGGLIGSSVTKKTNCVITGIKNRGRLMDEFKSTKLRRAESLILCGQDIYIMSESEFLEIVNN